MKPYLVETKVTRADGTEVVLHTMTCESAEPPTVTVSDLTVLETLTPTEAAALADSMLTPKAESGGEEIHPPHDAVDDASGSPVP